MQQLRFEEKWDKTISPQDRKLMEDSFLESINKLESNVEFTPIRQAFNHRNDLLVTVLIHNPTTSHLTFHNQEISYVENNKVVASHTFHIPTLQVEPQTSMPWTFIFPNNCLTSSVLNKNGYLLFC